MYDQLSAGLSTSTFFGFLSISKKSGIHFYAGLELRAYSKIKDLITILLVVKLIKLEKTILEV